MPESPKCNTIITVLLPINSLKLLSIAGLTGQKCYFSSLLKGTSGLHWTSNPFPSWLCFKLHYPFYTWLPIEGLINHIRVGPVWLQAFIPTKQEPHLIIDWGQEIKQVGIRCGSWLAGMKTCSHISADLLPKNFVVNGGERSARCLWRFW